MLHVFTSNKIQKHFLIKKLMCLSKFKYTKRTAEGNLKKLLYVHVTVHRNKFLFIKTNQTK